eukprot:TRINITY_DN608_c1_g1_i1.p1 TRINITY_DN608_c1_g1~~TRINITY_DN608_c1_g1_i1.p1  ORF type:complete len:417 (-),score=162.41 TRINITY_DN608_c1_g1_i1:267-1442(-)
MHTRHLFALLVLASVLASATAGGLYSANSKVVQLEASNFKQLVLDSPDVWMVEFYAPWCGHCKNLAPQWETAASNLEGVVSIGAVNCDEDKNKQLCGQYGVQGFPTIKVAAPNKADAKKKFDDYRGERSAAAIAKFASSSIPNVVTSVTKKSFEGFVADATDHTYALLFTPKKTASPTFKALSLHFRGRLQLGMVHSEDPLAAELEVNDAPALVVFKGDERVVYEGKLKPAKLRAFLSDFAAPLKSAASDAKKAPPPPEQKPVTSVDEVTDAETLEELCYSKRVCALGVLDGENASAEELQAQQDILLAAAKENAKLARFAWVDASRFPEFVAGLELSPNYPQLAIVSPSKKAVSQMIGSFTKEKMTSWIQGVLAGKKRLYPLDSAALPKL